MDHAKGVQMRIEPRTAVLVILGAAFASFVLSVSLWFGVLGDPDRQTACSWGCGCPRSWRSEPCSARAAADDGSPARDRPRRALLIGTLIFIAVFTAALGLGYARFAEMGDRAEDRERRRSALSSRP